MNKNQNEKIVLIDELRKIIKRYNPTELEEYGDEYGLISDISALIYKYDEVNSRKQRVMRRWGADGVPEDAGFYWVRTTIHGYHFDLCRENLTKDNIQSGKICDRVVTHWLEIERRPVLPENEESWLRI